MSIGTAISGSIPVLVPQENVNDESVTLVRWLVENGSPITEGQPIAEIETSKALVEIAAPGSGFLHHAAKAGRDIPVGSAMAHVTQEAEAPRSVPNATAVASPIADPPTAVPTVESDAPRFTPLAAKLARDVGLDARDFAGQRKVRQSDVAERLRQPDRVRTVPLRDYSGPARFSARALALLEARGLSRDRFQGMGLVRERDIEALINGTSPSVAPAVEPPAHEPGGTPPPQPVEPAITGVPGVPVRSVQLTRRKRVEGQQLAAGLRHTVPSTVVVSCGTRGLRSAAQLNPALQGSATPLILFEAARLLRQHPELNAYWTVGTAHQYEAVNVGFAVDAGHGLKVPVIKDADRKSLPELAAEFHSLVLAYLENRLTPADLGGGTFTVTDLSSEGVTNFVPLISRGQSAILGVGAETGVSREGAGAFNLILTFDHQLSDGRQAARFLTALRDRLAAYEEVLLPAASAAEPSCSRCFGTPTDLKRIHAYLIPTLDASGGTRPMCTRCLEGW